MALTYDIKFKRKIEKKEALKTLIKENDESLFIIYDLYTPTFGYVESLFDDYEINLDLGKISQIGFRITDTEADQLVFRKSLIETVHKITNEIYPEEDYYFDFNGDIIHEMRENGVVKRNNKSGFFVDI
ncbi:MAG: hypothetical protein ACPGVD_08170 [Flavobacteriales bacterium]